MKLTSHEKKILELINQYPDIIKDPISRKKVAEKYSLSEKTLRNRIGDLKKYGFIRKDTIMNHKPIGNQNDGLDLLIFSTLIWGNRQFLIKNFFLVSILSFIIVFSLPKTFTSTAILMPPTSESGGIGNLMGALSSLPFSGLNSKTNDESLSIIAILKSRTLFEKVINKFDLLKFYELSNMDKALVALSNNTSFEVLDEGTIRITVSLKTKYFHNDESEEVIKVLCRDMVDYFIEQLDLINKSLKTEKASFHRKFIEQRYKNNLDDLKVAEDSLRMFQEKYKMIALPEQTSAVIEAASALKAQILSNEVKLGVMMGALNATHPDIANIKKENVELNKKMIELEYGQNILNYEQSNLFPSLSDVPDLGIKLVRLKREVEIQNSLFVFLTQQYEEAKIKEAKDTPTVQVLDHPKIPYQKSAPKRLSILLICVFILMFLNILFIINRSEPKY